MAFEKLPRLASLDVKEEMDEKVINANEALEWSSFTLGILTGEIKDAVDKAIDTYDNLCKAQRLPCEISEKATNALEAQIKQVNTLR